MIKNDSGFAHLLVIILIAAVIGGLFFILKSYKFDSNLSFAKRRYRPTPTPTVTPIPSPGLRDIASPKGILVGAALDFWGRNEPDFDNTAAREFNLATPGGGFFYQIIHPDKDTFNFTEADTATNFGVKNGMSIMSGGPMTFWWADQQVAYLQNLSSAELKSELQKHISTVMGRYPQIKYWLVVNEHIGRASPVWSKIGPNTDSYVDLAFNWARQASPTGKLIYNENGIEFGGAKSDRMYNHVKALKSRGIPVDAVGFQMHLRENVDYNMTALADTIRRFKGLGVAVYITEMDVRIKTDDGITDAELNHQKQIYSDVVRTALNNGVKIINFWGFTDKYSWIPGSFPGWGSALIFDENYKKKPSYFGIEAVLKNY